MKFVFLLVCMSVVPWVQCTTREPRKDMTRDEKFFKDHGYKMRYREHKEFREDEEDGVDPGSDEELKKERKEARRDRMIEHRLQKKQHEKEEEAADYTMTYVGYNTTTPSPNNLANTTAAETTTESTTEGAGTTVVTTEGAEANATGIAAKNAGESADAVTETHEGKSSLVDIDLALLKNSNLNKLIKNQLGSVVKQSNLLGTLQQAPQVGMPSVGGLTGGLGGLTGGLPISGLTGALGGLTGSLGGLTGGLTGAAGGLPVVGGLAGNLPTSGLTGGLPSTNNLNNNNNVASNIQKTAQKLLEIDLNGKQFLALPA